MINYVCVCLHDPSLVQPQTGHLQACEPDVHGLTCVNAPRVHRYDALPSLEISQRLNATNVPVPRVFSHLQVSKPTLLKPTDSREPSAMHIYANIARMFVVATSKMRFFQQTSPHTLSMLAMQTAEVNIHDAEITVDLECVIELNCACRRPRCRVPVNGQPHSRIPMFR